MEDPTADASNDGPVLRRLDWLAWLLDSCIRIPFTQVRIGIDGLVGLIPGFGDLVLAILGLYPVLEAWRLKLPPRHLLRMLFHLAVDTAVGAIPIVGDVFDFGYRANKRNVDIVREQLRQRAAARDS